MDERVQDTSDRYRTGLATRRAVLGDAHVDRAEDAAPISTGRSRS